MANSFLTEFYEMWKEYTLEKEMLDTLKANPLRESDYQQMVKRFEASFSERNTVDVAADWLRSQGLIVPDEEG